MNWIVANLSAALSFFSAMMKTIYDILTINPFTYKGGAVWNATEGIYDALCGTALSLLVIFFMMGLFTEIKEAIVHQRTGGFYYMFIILGFVVAIVLSGKYLMALAFWIGKELIDNVVIRNGVNIIDISWVEVPDAIVNITNGLSMKDGIIFWVVTLIAALIVMVSTFTILLTVYGRLFNIYLHLAMAPLAFSCITSRKLQIHLEAYIKSFVGVLLEGVVIITVCIIFSAFAGNFEINNPDAESHEEQQFTPNNVLENDYEVPVIEETLTDTISDGADNLFGSSEDNAEAAEKLWLYIGETLFLYMLMAAVIKGADTFVKQKFAL